MSRCKFFIVLIFLSVLLSSCLSYKLSTGESIKLVSGGTISPTFNSLYNTIESLVQEVRSFSTSTNSGIDYIVSLHNKLEERGIKTALVVVNTDTDIPYYSCVAIDTVDRGLCYFDIVPFDLDINLEEVVQSVFLERGRPIGFIASKFTKGNTYSWYTDYLEEFYKYYTYAEYILEYREVVESNRARLDFILSTNWRIRYLIESSPSYLVPSWYITTFNTRIDKFNNYAKLFDIELEDYNKELAKFQTLDASYPQNIYYTFEINTNNRSPTYTPPPKILPPQFLPSNLPATLSEVEQLLVSDDSYSQKSKPDRSVIKVERITEKNFIVNSIKLIW